MVISEIKVWSFAAAPERLRRLFPEGEWIAFIPHQLAGDDVEVLFTRWHDRDFPVHRLALGGGDVVLCGSNPLSDTSHQQPVRRPVAEARNTRMTGSATPALTKH
jgi:hypothetical protein